MVDGAFSSGIHSQIIFTLTIPAAHADIATNQAQSNTKTAGTNLFPTQVAHGQLTLSSMQGTHWARLALMGAFGAGTAVSLLPLSCT
ncbi:hypothetical protein EU642_22360 [Salmonella enterica]|nr:hypothetical protein [Salmonella enterica]EAR6391596.1 hypothetical protein [Salmonella enterica]EAV1285360.1 hypothetical protein [Salmonella enterica]